MGTNCIIIAGIVGFFLIEKIVSTYLSDGGHDHSHHDLSEAELKKKTLAEQKAYREKKKVCHDDKETVKYKSYAVMTLVGDFLHNFTDGLSIGVAYVASKFSSLLISIDYRFGVVTTMAMLFHEIPHEVGDFAVLFQLKYNICQILGFQLLTAIGAMIGTVVGSIMGKLYLEQCLAFTSGGFLYFAINGLMSELKEVKSIGQLLICLFSMAFGLYFMFVFALFE